VLTKILTWFYHVLDGLRAKRVERLRVLAKILTWQSVFSRILGRTEFASQLLEQTLALLEEPELAGQDTRPEKAFVLKEMGWIAYGSDREEARRLFKQSLALYQELGDRWGTADALHGLARAAWSLGLYDEAKQSDEESLALRRALGDPRGIADSLMTLGITALEQGQLEEAERLVREGFVICQEMGDRASIADGLIYLGGTFLGLGKFSEAHSRLEESVAIYNDLGSCSGLAHSNSLLGAANMYLGRYEQARAYGQKGLTLSREAGYLPGIGGCCCLLGRVVLAGEAYAEAQQLLKESVAVYRKIMHRCFLGQALALLGVAERGLGQLPEAGQHLYEALRTAAPFSEFRTLMYALLAIALLLADRCQKERAVELYALASRYPYVANSRWFEDIAGRHIAAVAATLPPDVVAAAQERGKARDLEATVAELLAELGG